MKSLRVLAFLVAGSALASSARAQVNARLTINAAQVLPRLVDDRQFSVNTAIWDSSFVGSPTIALMQAADFRALRYPGGSASDNYDWKNHTNIDPGTHKVTQWYGPNFDQFAATAATLHADGIITVNYCNDTPQDAAAWVTYSNVTKKYGMKYWEIGNEVYGTWETDTNSVPNDPYTYATRAQAYIAQMKAADPTIKIGVVAVTGEDSDINNRTHLVTNPVTLVQHYGWTPVMLSTLKALGVTPDFIIYHRYEEQPPNENDAVLLQDAKTWANDAADLRTQLNQYLGTAAASGIEILCTENNGDNGDSKQTTSLVNGLYLADSIGSLMQTEIRSLAWWDFRNGQSTSGNLSSNLYGWRPYGDMGIVSGGNDAYPTYYVYKVLSHFARGGDSVVAATTNSNLVSAYAALRKDGSLSVMAINKFYPLQTVTATITLTGFTPGASATSYVYGVPQDNAAKANAASPGSGGNQDVAVSNVPIPGTTFTVSLVPYSVTVLSILPPAVQPVVTTPPASITVGSSSSAVFWVAATGGNLSYQWKANNQSIAGATSSRLTLTPLQASSYASGTSFTCVVTNSAGTATSPPAVLTIANSSNPGRLVNLSVLTTAGKNQILTIGFVTGGAGTAGSQTLLMRATGPALAGFGVSGVLADPTLSVFSGSTQINSNDNWATPSSNQTLVTAADSATFAFPLSNPNSLDAALVTTLAASPGYSIQVSGNGSASGSTLAEVYDATPAGTYTPASPRLINLSCLQQVGSGGVLTAGFYIGGTTARTLLIRATGPALATAPFNLSGTMPDPALSLHQTVNGQDTTIISNAGWGGASDITATASAVYAFTLSNPASLDSVLLVTLAPGGYSVQAASTSGAAGSTLIEIYEVP